ncbi:phosphohydrolase [Streptococcus pneumoniae GA17328]|nr:phosphohydrolase [Streptococcus pneumoniae GA17328]
MEIKNHFGVYCVCFENGKLLCIEKREALINIGMIYLEAVSNLVKD